MQGGQMVVEEPVRLASVLTSSRPSFLPSLTKVVGTLGPKSRSVEVIEGCLKVGMSVARFDFSGFDETYHQETLDNLRTAVKNVEKLCAVFLFQKSAVHKCNITGKPAIITRVVDGMVDNLRPTRAEATDVANAVLDGP